ncbi:hypothetical protein PT974_07655 [Cladobotryum mycophilum]|uniref:Uncharacterized protein n=1 Tax=Cladobotryum mycophilum TaxID=491253 RepID=A0ABR0SPV5_9HYPO
MLEIVPSKQHLEKYLSWLQEQKKNMVSGQWGPLVLEVKDWASYDPESRDRLWSRKVEASLYWEM